MALVAVPVGVLIVIDPVVAVAGTAAMTWVPILLKIVADILLNLTAAAPAKLTPLKVTLVPGDPWLGLKLLIMGSWTLSLNIVPQPV